MELCKRPKHFPSPRIVKYAFIFRYFCSSRTTPERTKLLTDIICDRMWHLMVCVCVRVHVLVHLYMRAPIDVRIAFIYLAHVFRLGVWNGGNLVRTDLCLSQFLDAYIFNLLRFATDCRRCCCCILNRRVDLYYICASSVLLRRKNKQNVLGSLMECSRDGQEKPPSCLWSCAA